MNLRYCLVLFISLLVATALAGCGYIPSTEITAATTAPAVSTTLTPSTPSTTSTTSTSTSTTTSLAGLPARVSAVVGLTETATALSDNLVWCATSGGVLTKELPANNSVATGGRGSTIVYSDQNTGLIHVWHPGKTPPNDVQTIDLGISGPLSDGMALSPDEKTLALIRGEPLPQDQWKTQAYLIDLESQRVSNWHWLLSTVDSDLVPALRWDKNSTAVYASFGPPGGSLGERSYRYDVTTGQSTEITGVATVLDVGGQGQVLGLALSSSFEPEVQLPGGGGAEPIVFWQDGQRVLLPRDSGLTSEDFAHISDDGRTIVVWGHTGRTSGLEVLKLQQAGWTVSFLYSDDSKFILPWGGFEGGSSLYCLQAGDYPAETQGFPPNLCLFELDADTGEVVPLMRLPGGPDDYSHAVEIGRTED